MSKRRPAQSDSQKPEIKTVDLAELTPAAYNPRAISDEAFAGLKHSLSEFGYVDLIIVNRRNLRIVGGEQRWKALREQGVTRAPVMLVDLDLKREKALNVTLNNPAIAGRYTDELQALLAEIEAEMGAASVELRLNELRAEAAASAPAEPYVLDTSSPPTLTWVLLAIATVRYGEIAESIARIASVPGLRMEMCSNDAQAN